MHLESQQNKQVPTTENQKQPNGVIGSQNDERPSRVGNVMHDVIWRGLHSKRGRSGPSGR